METRKNNWRDKIERWETTEYSCRQYCSVSAYTVACIVRSAIAFITIIPEVLFIAISASLN